MTYVDGFVAALPTANRERYRTHAEKAAVVFKEYGARRDLSGHLPAIACPDELVELLETLHTDHNRRHP